MAFGTSPNARNASPSRPAKAEDRSRSKRAPRRDGRGFFRSVSSPPTSCPPPNDPKWWPVPAPSRDFAPSGRTVAAGDRSVPMLMIARPGSDGQPGTGHPPSLLSRAGRHLAGEGHPARPPPSDRFAATNPPPRPARAHRPEGGRSPLPRRAGDGKSRRRPRPAGDRSARRTIGLRPQVPTGPPPFGPAPPRPESPLVPRHSGPIGIQPRWAYGATRLRRQKSSAPLPYEAGGLRVRTPSGL